VIVPTVMRSVPSVFVFLLVSFVLPVRAQEKVSPLNTPSPQPKTDKEYFAAGHSLERKKDYQGAAEDFEKAIAINPNDRRYYNNLGYCLDQLGRYDEAIAAFSQATALDSNDSYAYRAIGVCYYEKKDFNSAIDFIRAAISLNPSDAVSHRWLGFIYYQTKNNTGAINALDDALKINPNEFDANYWRGLTALRISAFADASRFLTKAVERRPKDFNANLWLGISLVRERKFKEALPRFEKAHELNPNDKRAEFELFACYLATNQTDKAGHVYPRLVEGLAAALVLIYGIWLIALLPFSLPIRAKLFPGFWFSIAWLGLFFEGQIAFLLLLVAMPWLGLHEVVLNGTMFAALPVILVAFLGFTRQPWGEPFKWPLRFGSLKIIGLSLLLIFVTILISGALAHLYTSLTQKPFPVSRTVPVIRGAIGSNPVTAWLGIALVIPCVEEILFRGLLFGAFLKFFGATGAILASSFIFVCVHLQLFGFVALLILGLTLGWARLRTGSLGLPIALHGLNNAIAMAVITFGPVPTTN
jgi:tetratricopeptide (TPR) repeat protein